MDWSSQDVNWWTGLVWITCGLLWCFYQLFGLSFWWHPFTSIGEKVMECYISPNLMKKTNSSISWMVRGWAHFQQMFIFGWTIPLNIYFKPNPKTIEINWMDKMWKVLILNVFYSVQRSIFLKVTRAEGSYWNRAYMWPWSTKAVISNTGIFVAIANNTLYESKLSIFLLCQKSLGY